jgi:integrase
VRNRWATSCIHGCAYTQTAFEIPYLPTLTPAGARRVRRVGPEGRTPGACASGHDGATCRRLDKLTPAHVQRLVAETRNSQTSLGRTPSAATQRHVHKLVRNALGDALRLELVTRNVATQVKAPPMARQRRPELGVAEARRLLEVIGGERLEALYVLALTTGLRRGELLALRWDDVDLGSRQLHVRRALQRVGGKLHMVEPKTGSSVRTVVLPKLALRYLREHKKRQNRERLALGDAWREHGLVFASSVGTAIEPRNVNRRWDELRAKAGLDWLRLHDLRHG